MANKGLFSILILVIVLAVALSLGIWFANIIAQNPQPETQKSAALKIKKEIYEKIVSDSAGSISLPLEDENFGRPNPFLNY